MEEFFTRFWEDLIGRIGGPMSIRLIIQPTIATILGARAGFKDYRERKSPYIMAILTDREHRVDFLRQGWKAIAKVFVAAFLLDSVYQFVALKKFYPGEALIVAFCLAVLPYLFMRAAVNRIRCLTTTIIF